MLVKIFIVRAQNASSDSAFGVVRTLGDPFTDRAKAETRRDNFLASYQHMAAHAFIETHWLEIED